MLAVFRRSLNTWPVRILFIVLVGAFGVWGIGNVLPNLLGNDGSAAKVGGVAISPQQVDGAYRQQLQSVGQQLGGADKVTAPMRMMIAEQAAATLISQAAIDQMARRMGLAAPDRDVQHEVFGMDIFKGAGGGFDKSRFDQLLQANGMSEVEFLHLMQAQIIRNQLLNSVRGAVVAPPVMVKTAYAFQNQTRIAALVTLPFAAAPVPPPPSAATLQRWYKNHPTEFSSPEYRRITLVILSPDVLARDVQVPQADVQAAYQRMVAEAPPATETRSLEVVLSGSAASASAIAKSWQGGADWAAVQKAAAAAGATALDLPKVTADQVPNAALGAAAFKAPADAVQGPVAAGPGRFAVFKVTAIDKTASVQSFAAAAPALRQQIARERALALVDSRVNQLQDALAGRTPLEKLPADLGLAALQGSIDQNGMTEQGTPAPIPGTPALRQAVVDQAFKQRIHQPAALINGPDNSYFALTVDGITPAATKPYDQVKDQVLASWTAAEQRREQNLAATHLLQGLKGGRTLQALAGAAGLAVSTTPPLTRQGQAPDGVPPNLIAPLFSLGQGEATMVETPDGFVVAQLSAITNPSPSADPVGYDQLKAALSASLANDMQAVFAGVVTAAANPRINQSVIQQIAQP
ncbi:SurA N-terminal domain-containing protein [Acidisoma sp. C75]